MREEKELEEAAAEEGRLAISASQASISLMLPTGEEEEEEEEERAAE